MFDAPRRPSMQTGRGSVDFGAKPQPDPAAVYQYLLDMLQMMQDSMPTPPPDTNMPQIDLPPGEMEELQKRRWILTNLLRGQGQG